ncbi:MAG TPA: vancomycin resistance protein [Desulfosporosinus sp.]|jgi:vancomycin resistance protein YoaR|nr:vancomycin resistance protein [Desulfosporosinus sp.]
MNTGLGVEPKNELLSKDVKWRKYALVSMGLIFIILFSVGTLALIYTHDDQRFQKNLTISGINVGDLTQAEAKKIIDVEVDRLENQTIKLNVGQQAPEVKLKDLGLGVQDDLALQEGYDIGRTGSIYHKIVSKMSEKTPKDMTLSQTWDASKLSVTLKKTLEPFDNLAVDANFQISKENVMTIKSDHVGSIVDSEALIMKVKGINIYTLVPELKVDFKEQKPLITALQLEEQKITGLLSTYTTQFDPSQTARTENVKIAAKALDMAIIKPGATLSFNQIVGERTVKDGYKDAFIIVDGKFIPGLAGGICQVSSTLYNTGLLANLAVTERSNHSLAITYVPLGQDATVAYPSTDLKFNNNSAGYLLVRTKTTNNTLTIEFYGKVKPGQEVLIANNTPAVGASVLNQQGQSTYIVKSSRTVKENGVIISSEALQQSRYLRHQS